MRFQVTKKVAKKEKFPEVEVVEMGVAAIDQLSSLLETDHQFLRKYLAENNCTDEFLPELHVFKWCSRYDARTLESYSNIQKHSSNKMQFGKVFF